MDTHPNKLEWALNIREILNLNIEHNPNTIFDNIGDFLFQVRGWLVEHNLTVHLINYDPTVLNDISKQIEKSKVKLHNLKDYESICRLRDLELKYRVLMNNYESFDSHKNLSFWQTARTKNDVVLEYHCFHENKISTYFLGFFSVFYTDSDFDILNKIRKYGY